MFYHLKANNHDLKNYPFMFSHNLSMYQFVTTYQEVMTTVIFLNQPQNVKLLSAMKQEQTIHYE